MYAILGPKHVFSTFQETVWSHLKREYSVRLLMLIDLEFIITFQGIRFLIWNSLEG